jgi:hypothetical protein
MMELCKDSRILRSNFGEIKFFRTCYHEYSIGLSPVS